MLSGIENVRVQVVVFSVVFRCQNGASIADDLNVDVYLSPGIWDDEGTVGALSEHSE